MKSIAHVVVSAVFFAVIWGMYPEAFSSEQSIEASSLEKIKKEKLNTKVIMNQFLEQLVALRKYMISDAKFSDPKNRVEISEHLKQFTQIAKATEHDPHLHLENLKISRDVLLNHISETEKVFREGSKPFARWMLHSTIYMCMSCHTQLPTTNRPYFNFKEENSYFSEFEQAEFLFAVRNFDEAVKLYDSVVRKMSHAENMEVERSLERLVAYYTRINRNPQMAIEKFQKYLLLKKIPSNIRQDLKSWIAQFQLWKSQQSLDAKTATETEILAFAKSNLDPEFAAKEMSSDSPNLVNYLRVSGVLYEYMQNHQGSKITPQILYWLSVCDRYTNNNIFFSLADLYLRECIIQYPADPIAKKCYEEYEMETILGYTGSMGTNIPADVRADLKALKALVQSHGKLKQELNSR